MLKFFKNYYHSKLLPLFRNTVDEIRHPGNNPQIVAQSMALGVLIAFIIPIGLQLLAMTMILLVFRYNFIIASSISLISNPFTVLPIYYAGIVVGEFSLSEKFPWKFFDDLVEKPSWGRLLEFDFKSIIIVLTGLGIMGIIASAITYFLSFRLINYIKNKNITL